MKKNAVALCFLLVLLIFNVTALLFLKSASANFKPYPPPEITIDSPAKNGIYSQSNVPLNVKVVLLRYSPSFEFEAVDWLNYSLDGKPDVPLAVVQQYGKDMPERIFTGSGIFSGLSDGMHVLFVHGESTFKKYYNDSYFTATVYFTVDTVNPSITVYSPMALGTYTSTNLSLNYFVSEPISWAGYSLDQDANVTSRINTTITGLSYGKHSLKVYANDSAGNEAASNSIVFTVKDVEAPAISVLSVEGKTYNTTDIPLNFTVNKPASWMAYSLDNQANVTVTGNVTLTALTSGSHTLTVYANNTSGNMGASETVTFNVAEEQEQEAEPFPTTFAAASASTVVIGLGLIVYLTKHKLAHNLNKN
jgi:hypothetical protein